MFGLPFVQQPFQACVLAFEGLEFFGVLFGHAVVFSRQGHTLAVETPELSNCFLSVVSDSTK